MILLVDSECPDQMAQKGQVDLCFHCSHMHKDMFLHGLAQIWIRSIISIKYNEVLKTLKWKF